MSEHSQLLGLDLAIRWINAAEDAGVLSIDDLCARTEADIRKWPKIRRWPKACDRCVLDVKAALAAKGLKLKDSQPPQPQPVPTVRVRVAVAIDAEGDWVASGHRFGLYQHPSDEVARDDLANRTPEGRLHHLVWVEADVPLPRAKAVEGEVVQ